jgi:hypothetical protein
MGEGIGDEVSNWALPLIGCGVSMALVPSVELNSEYDKKDVYNL